MAIIGEKITLDKPLVGNIARNQMESKMELATRGALYVGTGNKTEVTPDGGGDKGPIPITSHIAPNGASDNGKVLVADASQAVGWKVAKIKADNLEGGRVAQATNADQATQATKADTVSYDGNYKSFIDAFVSACLLKIYPIGSIYMTVDGDVDPSTFLGGTWERWGQGRVPVGVNESDADFKEAGKEGGEKTHTLEYSEMPEHSHIEQLVYNNSVVKWSYGEGHGTGYSYTFTPAVEQVNKPRDGVYTDSAGGKNAHNNLQPYITCYMWKRTA